MELELIVFKETGKYYSSNIVSFENDVPLFDDTFMTLVQDNLPARVQNGYVIVRDTGKYSTQFHICLYTLDFKGELKR